MLRLSVKNIENESGELCDQEGFMKNKVAYLFLFIAISMGAFASETGFSTQFGNYGLSDYDEDDNSYETYFQWGTTLYFEDSAGLDENLKYRFELVRDPVSGYSLNSILELGTDWYSLGIGPVFGILNESFTLIKPGFGGRLKAQWPGKVFGEIGGASIPALYVGAEDDYSSYNGYYTLGFYIKQNHILCYFTQSLTNYSNLSDAYTNEYLSYIFYSDFYDKSSMFKIQTKLGYEILSKTFLIGEDIEIRNILFGLQADLFLGPKAKVFIGLDNKIYPGTYGDIKLKDVPLYLVSFNSGFSWSF